MRIIRIGRAPGNDYVISHPSVSSSHAEIRLMDNGEMLFVDHSTNGSTVDHRPVHHSSCPLLGHETIGFPGHIFVPVKEILPKFSTFRMYAQPPVQSTGTQFYGGYHQQPVYSPQYGRVFSTRPGMGFAETLTYFFNHYADFDGRARRQEYWYMALWDLIFNLVPFVNILWIIATIIPSLALSARRLHDTGKSGLLLLILLVPIVGWIVIFVFTLQDSDPMPNQYGPSPKYIS